jgi:hypothetical protein
MATLKQSKFLCLLPLLACGSMQQQVPVKDQLEAEYAQIVAGFKRNDPEGWIARLSPNFRLKLFNGSEQSREWATNYVRQNAGTFNIETESEVLRVNRQEIKRIPPPGQSRE